MEFDRLKELWNEQTKPGLHAEGKSAESPAALKKKLRAARRKELMKRMPLVVVEVGLVVLLALWLGYETTTKARMGIVIAMTGIIMVLPLSEMMRFRLSSAAKDLSLVEHAFQEQALAKARIALDRWYAYLANVPVTIGLTIYLHSTNPSIEKALACIFGAIGLIAACYWRDRYRLKHYLLPLVWDVDRDIEALVGDKEEEEKLVPKQGIYFKAMIAFSVVAVGIPIGIGLLDLLGYLRFLGVFVGGLGMIMYVVPWFILYYLRKRGPWKASSVILSVVIFVIVWFTFMHYVYWPYFRELSSFSQEFLEGGIGIIWGISIVGLYLAVNYYRGRMP